RTPSEENSVASSSSYKEGALFKKVIMKLSGRVQFIIGLMFEQDLGGSGDWKTRKRSFDFIPHYKVSLRTPEFARKFAGKEVNYIITTSMNNTNFIGRYMMLSAALEVIICIYRYRSSHL